MVHPEHTVLKQASAPLPIGYYNKLDDERKTTVNHGDLTLALRSIIFWELCIYLGHKLISFPIQTGLNQGNQGVSSCTSLD